MYIFVTASKDATIYEGSPSGNYGQSSILKIGRVWEDQVLFNYRSILAFDNSDIIAKLSSSFITGNLTCSLKLFDCYSNQGNQPYDFYINIHELASYSFIEGRGINEHGYQSGAANWLLATRTQNWTNSGSDYNPEQSWSAYFENGNEDINVNLNNWVTTSNYGLLLKLEDSIESDASTSIDTKRFFSKQSSTIFRPRIEISWDDSLKDDKGIFVYNTNNNICFYNTIGGKLSNVVASTASVGLRIYPSGYATSVLVAYATANKVKTGIYLAQNINITSSYASLSISGGATYSYANPDIWDLRWFSGSTQIYSEYMSAQSQSIFSQMGNDALVIKCTNLKTKYKRSDIARFDFFVRKRYPDYAFASGNEHLSNLIIPNMYYQIEDAIDFEPSYVYMPYNNASTKLSYDKDGNYFNLVMSSFYPNRLYKIKLKYEIENQEIEYLESFNFVVVN